MTVRIAIIGFGKIARDEHVPAIAGNPDCELVAVVSGSGDPGIGVPWFKTPAELLDRMAGEVDAVAICTPPVPRYAIARAALLSGFDVLLEKPPAATLGEVAHLLELAVEAERTLYATWHSQHAAGVEQAEEALRGQEIAALEINWREDVRKWHPGQQWIWAPGGFGVFDPGINALSIATRILPEPLFVREATLVVPENRQSPIAARLDFGDGMSADFDWRYEQGEQWTIRIETKAGQRIELRDGGARLLIDGAEQSVGPHGEYPSIYTEFARLVGAEISAVDMEPLRIVADAFMVGARETTEPFA